MVHGHTGFSHPTQAKRGLHGAPSVCGGIGVDSCLIAAAGLVQHDWRGADAYSIPLKPKAHEWGTVHRA
ncbi:MAG TPA: hypothetical protein VMV54_06185 [Acidocella sp.]|nr:hypothetical protein [Acidocella sp.]